MLYFFILALIVWTVLLINVYRAQTHLLSLDKFQRTIEDYPKISIVIAVKDGEIEIESTLKRLLSFKYPNYEVIAVNDRSKDKTEIIIQDYASRFSQLIGVHIKVLPTGWLGKVHALHQGVQKASGEYILFMDADIVIDEQVISSSVNACRQNNLDHLAVVPDFIPGSYLLNVMTATSTFLFTVSARPWLDVADRPLESTKGIGAYNFIRRDSFIKTEGFTWLKMDVADDVALAQLIVRNGGRSLLMKAGSSGPALSWYENFKALVYGLEKNIVGGFTNYNWFLVGVMFSISLLTLYVPFGALFRYPMITLLFFIINGIFVFKIKRYMKQSSIELFSFPLGFALLGCILLRSALICYKNGGIKWSGTYYPLKDLREGTRVKLGF